MGDYAFAKLSESELGQRKRKDECVDSVGCGQVFSTLHVNSDYQEIKIDKTD